MKRARRKKATTSVVTGERRAAARRERAEEERRPKGRGLGAAVVGSGGSEGEVGGGGLAMAKGLEAGAGAAGESKGMPPKSRRARPPIPRRGTRPQILYRLLRFFLP